MVAVQPQHSARTFLLLLLLLPAALGLGRDVLLPRESRQEKPQLSSTPLETGGARRRLQQSPPPIRIAVLDLSDLAREAGLPACDPDLEFKVAPGSGVVYLHTYRWEAVSHEYGQHASPWYLARAIRNSKVYSNDTETADLVFVDDYCYLTKWLAWAHDSFQGPNPGLLLTQLYKKMYRHPRWQRDAGRGFVFFAPHPGWNSREATNAIADHRCFQAAPSYHIVVERGQRNGCHSYNPDGMMIVPYSSTNDPPTARKRDILLFFKGSCGLDTSPAGKQLRTHLVGAMKGQGLDVIMQCSDKESKFEGHGVVMELTSRSLFCAVLPGDSASSRRITEIVMAGCIPVFIGPPWHTIPFGWAVDWPAISYFVNITQSDTRKWMGDAVMQTQLSKDVRPHGTDAQWWIPDIEGVEDVAVQLPIEGIVPYLRKLNPRKVAAKQSQVLKEAAKFQYKPYFKPEFGEHPETAVDVILQKLVDSKDYPTVPYGLG